GMLKTFALRGRELPLTVYGPPGLRELFSTLRRVFGRLTYPLEVVELEPGEGLERGENNLVTFPVAHGGQSLGVALVEQPRPGRWVPRGPGGGLRQAGERVGLGGGRVIARDEVLGPPRPGRRVVLSGDTAPSPTVAEAARGAEVLVHEATFLEEERERARETA